MNAKKIKVLLVDDHAVVRNGMQLMLGAADDIEVAAEAETVQEALSVSRERDLDVVLLDINLPDKSGLDLIKLLREEKPKLAVLVLSMYSEEIYAVRAFKHGAAGYLTKCSNAATVVAAVRKAASGGKYVSPAMMEKLASVIGGDSLGGHESASDRGVGGVKVVASGGSLVRVAEVVHLRHSTVTAYRARGLGEKGGRGHAEV